MNRPRKLSVVDLEKLCGVESHTDKRCDNCGIILSFPRSFTKDTLCAVCSTLLGALLQNGNQYWFKLHEQYAADILADVIHKKIMMGGGDGEEINQ